MLAGALVKAAETDAQGQGAWRETGAAFFQRRSKKPRA
ncbi:MAG: hypothetical protein ABW164_02125 [Sphingobium sp.]